MILGKSDTHAPPQDNQYDGYCVVLAYNTVGYHYSNFYCYLPNNPKPAAVDGLSMAGDFHEVEKIIKQNSGKVISRDPSREIDMSRFINLMYFFCDLDANVFRKEYFVKKYSEDYSVYACRVTFKAYEKPDLKYRHNQLYITELATLSKINSEDIHKIGTLFKEGK